MTDQDHLRAARERAYARLRMASCNEAVMLRAHGYGSPAYHRAREHTARMRTDFVLARKRFCTAMNEVIVSRSGEHVIPVEATR